MTLSQGMQKVTIRRMTPADLDAVVEIDSISFSLPWPRSSFGYELNNPVSRLWVAEAEEAGKAQVVGIICTWMIENEGHIATFAIHPDFRRRGLGNALLAFALLEAAHEGVELVYLEVRRSNEAAIQMYEKFGFAMTGIRAGYYSDNHEDALMMTLEKLEPIRIQAFLEN
jgi:[ribosomal protein S18]-alanine N-acetyltransferase